MSTTTTPISGNRPKKSTLADIILWPLSLLYGAVTGFRNHLYNISLKKSVGFIPAVICIGNLSVGGTGKSPMIEYLVRMLYDTYPLAVLSRGYGRKTSGFRLATQEDTAITIGDEPYQFYRKFRDSDVPVAVGEERVAAVPQILAEHPDLQMILLDDAFQHRAIRADLNILLSTYQRPFYHDQILPLGRLREARSGAKRAQIVVITKCPDDLSVQEQDKITAEVRRYTSDDVPVFFSTIAYGAPVPVFSSDRFNSEQEIIVFSGIANSTVFEDYARRHFRVVQSISFNDHHRYSQQDIKKLVAEVQQRGENVALLTTEKDMVKLIDHNESSLLKPVPLFYLPIQTSFISEEETFKRVVLRHVQQYFQSQDTNSL